MTDIRARVSVLVVNQKTNKFVLIFRHKNNQDYYSVPGGGIEKGESPEDAVGREIFEELGCRLKKIQKVSEVKTDTRLDFNYIATTDDYLLLVTGPEKDRLDSPDNLFRPEWHNQSSFRTDISIFPESARELLDIYIKKQYDIR
ncbi:MAG TPA: NUDIX domain-containing protein [Candidatus Methanoperedens sp.]|nr:NUDIX domain-containing protein [Candidatus Methanoperedens sp.]